MLSWHPNVELVPLRYGTALELHAKICFEVVLFVVCLFAPFLGAKWCHIYFDDVKYYQQVFNNLTP